MTTRLAVLDLLADGNWHSGVSMGAALGLSRAAIWKQVRGLREFGLVVSAERGRGYCLDRALDLFSGSEIRKGLAEATGQALESLDVLTVTASTNQCLTSRPTPLPERLRAVVAEYQTGGRGRRGRRWISPLGHGVCLSVSWAFEISPRDLSSLSLVVGVAVVRALARMGVDGVQLKWPNDIMAGDAKAGGILVEVAGESGGPLRAVIGIGLNVRPATRIAAALRDEGGNAAAVGLDELPNGGRLSRNALVAALLNELHSSLQIFGKEGFGAFLETWRRFDYLAGAPVVVSSGEDILRGTARGIGADGALLVEAHGRIVPVVAGDVTLRLPA